MTVINDEELKQRAFDAYRAAHGISEDRRLGDMPLQVVSEVLQAAQRMKSQEPRQ
jgi:hypothetical protein